MIKDEQFVKIEKMRKMKQVSRVQTLRSAWGRSFAVLAVISFIAILIGGILPGTVSAGQVTSRSITMSTSAASATSVTYTATFTPATSITHPDVILDFCSNDPLIGDSCTATAGTDVPNFTSAAASGWTVTTIGSNRGVILTTSTVSFTAATPVTITVTGVTNPSNTASFYGRVLTYTTGGASGHTSASPGSYTDYGGVALSTAANISITSKVFETLSYCVFQSSCGTPPTLTLGDPTTGALSASNAYVNNNAQYTIATNAASGAAVALRGTTLCRSSTPSDCNTGSAGVYTITGIGSSETASAVGSEQFGMCVDTTGATGSLAADSPYADSINNCHSGLSTGSYSGSSKFGFNDSTGANGTNNAGGSPLMSSTAPISSYTGTFAFLGNISATTEAGIYTTSLNTVATGTF